MSDYGDEDVASRASTRGWDVTTVGLGGHVQRLFPTCREGERIYAGALGTARQLWRESELQDVVKDSRVAQWCWRGVAVAIAHCVR